MRDAAGKINWREKAGGAAPAASRAVRHGFRPVRPTFPHFVNILPPPAVPSANIVLENETAGDGCRVHRAAAG